MQYAKFTKEHPVPEITEEQRRNAEKINVSQYRYNSCCNMYSAAIIDNILCVTVFDKSKDGDLFIKFRHFYDGESYATQSVVDNKKLAGTIDTYLSPWDRNILDTKTNEAFEQFFGDKFNCPDINSLRSVEDNILKARLAKKHKKIEDRIDERMSIVSNPPDDFYKWVKNWAFEKCRYFFYHYQKGKTQTGYCSHCKTVFSAQNIKHGKTTVCPSCKSELTCKALGRTTQYGIRDSAQAIYVERNTENGKPIIIERVFSVSQTIEGHQNGEKHIRVHHSFFEKGRHFYTADKLKPVGDASKEYYYYYGTFFQTSKSRWCDGSTFSGYIGELKGWIYPHNLITIMQSLDGVNNVEITAIVPHSKERFVSLVEKLKNYPCIENLAKQGHYQLMRSVADIYLRYYTDFEKYVIKGESSPSRALDIDKITLQQMGDIDEKSFILYKILQKHGFGNIELLERFTALGLQDNKSYVDGILSKYQMTAQRLVGYIEKQSALLKRDGNNVLSVYFDYLSMTRDLKMPKTDSVLFPKDVQKEHDAVMKIETDLKYDKQNKLLKQRGKILHTLDFYDGTFCIVAFDDASQFINESAKLGHCVKTYIERCSKGETNIYGIRKSDTPDEPYFTLTLSNNATVTQNLGKGNCTPPKEVKDFVKKWQKKIIAVKKDEFVRAANPKLKEKSA